MRHSYGSCSLCKLSRRRPQIRTALQQLGRNAYRNSLRQRCFKGIGISFYLGAGQRANQKRYRILGCLYPFFHNWEQRCGGIVLHLSLQICNFRCESTLITQLRFSKLLLSGFESALHNTEFIVKSNKIEIGGCGF